MMRIALVLCVLAPAAALRGAGQKTELLTDMRPDVVSKLLGEVTNQWTMDFVGVMSNTTSEVQAYSKMEKSCLTVAKSVISGSDGDEDRVSEYMNEVCSESSSSKMCTSFAKRMDDAMIGDANFNRNELKLAQFCKAFWNADVKTAAQEKKDQISAQEKADAEKKAAEEKEAAEKKAADDKAAAEKKEAEEKAAAEKKVVDDKAAAEAAEKAATEKKAAEEKAAAVQEKAADEQRASAEQLRGSIKAKTENLTAAINQTAANFATVFASTDAEVQKLLDHAKQAMSLATKKEEKAKADAVQKAKEEKEAKEAEEKVAAEKKANETAANQTAAFQPKNVTAPAKNASVPAKVNKTA